jgi:hypothetical protein
MTRDGWRESRALAPRGACRWWGVYRGLTPTASGFAPFRGKKSFLDELKALYDKHGIEYDPRWLA